MNIGLSVDQLRVSFGGLHALDGASVTFAPSKITALIGPNGSGKSTFVNRVSGQVRPGAGRVLLGEVDISKMRADRIVAQGLARTYQIPRVPPELTAREVIDVPLTYARRSKNLLIGLSDAESIGRYCDLSLLDRRCAELSVPDLRRLEVARALACAPSVLLLDEVMAGLSQADAQQFIRLVRQISASGVTIIVIEHVMQIVTELCEQVVVFNQGKLLASGEPADVLTNSAVREAYLGKGFVL